MSDAEAPVRACGNPGCNANASHSIGHWDNEDHLNMSYYCAVYAPPEAYSFDNEHDDRPGAYVDVREASVRSGLTQDYIRWVCDGAAAAQAEGEYHVVRHTIDAVGALKVHLNDVVSLAEVMSESKISPTIPRRRPGG